MLMAQDLPQGVPQLLSREQRDCGGFIVLAAKANLLFYKNYKSSSRSMELISGFSQMNWAIASALQCSVG